MTAIEQLALLPAPAMPEPIRPVLRLVPPPRRCERCGSRMARDNHEPLCSPCQCAPKCRVCAGRGTLGKDAKHVCYRCSGSGIGPIPDPRLRRLR